MSKPGQHDTRLYVKLERQVLELAQLCNQQQKAIEEITHKLTITATNLNVALFRYAVTERLVKDKLSITPEEIEQAGLAAIAADRQQRADESSTKELVQHDIPKDVPALRPRLLQAVQ